MPGIKKLNKIYDEEGLLGTKKFLEGNITITEKLDAYRFSFQVDDSKKLSFYKKNDNREISKIDRIVSDLYEKAISHIQSLPKNIINNIPKNTRFGFAYFPNEKPLRIKYSHIPKNNLVITDVSLRSSSGKVRKVYEDQNYLDNWASILNVGKSPIIFQGKLTEDQKYYILQMISGEHKTNAFFAQHIEGLFEKTYSKNQIIEGVVCKNNHGVTQLIDPAYQIFNDAINPKISRDFYDLTIIKIQEFMKEYDLPIFVNEMTSEDKYISVICQAYNQFIDERHINETFSPDFLKPNIIGSHGNLGRKFITNQNTLKRINKSLLNEELFKVFLISLRKKRNPHGLLNNSIIKSFNKIVESIEECVNNKDSIVSYSQINKIYEENDEEIKISEQQPNYIKLVASLQSAFTKKIQHKETEKLPGAICLIDKFDFVSNNFISIIEKNSDKNIILVNISKEKLKLSNEIFQLEDQDIKQVLKSIETKYANVKEIIHTPVFSLEKIFYETRKTGYEPIVFCCDEDSVANYTIQYNTSKFIFGDRIKINKNFDIKGINTEDKRKIFRSIEDDNYTEYKESSPEIMKYFWEIYKSRYNIWAK